jgi:hypothetical protein
MPPKYLGEHIISHETQHGFRFPPLLPHEKLPSMELIAKQSPPAETKHFRF